MKANIRTCPHCNTKYSVLQYMKTPFFLTFGQSWSCKNCEKALKVRTRRRIFILFLQLAWFSFILTVRNYSDGFLWYLALVLAMVAGYLGLSLLDTFDAGKEPTEF